MGKLSITSKKIIDGHEARVAYFLSEPNTGLCRIQYRGASFTLPDVLAEEIFHPKAESETAALVEKVERLEVDQQFRADPGELKKRYLRINRQLGKAIQRVKEVENGRERTTLALHTATTRAETLQVENDTLAERVEALTKINRRIQDYTDEVMFRVGDNS